MPLATKCCEFVCDLQAILRFHALLRNLSFVQSLGPTGVTFNFLVLPESKFGICGFATSPCLHLLSTVPTLRYDKGRGVTEKEIECREKGRGSSDKENPYFKSAVPQKCNPSSGRFL